MTCPLWYSILIFFLYGSTTVIDQYCPIVEILRSKSDTPQSVGLPWTTDQPDALPST